MPIPKELAQSLTYLRKKYKVSERDLVALARKLQRSEDNDEKSWEQIVYEFRERRKRRRM